MGKPGESLAGADERTGIDADQLAAAGAAERQPAASPQGSRSADHRPGWQSPGDEPEGESEGARTAVRLQPSEER